METSERATVGTCYLNPLYSKLVRYFWYYLLLYFGYIYILIIAKITNWCLEKGIQLSKKDIKKMLLYKELMRKITDEY